MEIQGVPGESPQEREQRLAELKEATAVNKRLKRARTTELKRQPEQVQRLAFLQDKLLEDSDVLDELLPGLLDDGVLPHTEEARLAAVVALRRLSAELGTEITTRWTTE